MAGGKKGKKLTKEEIEEMERIEAERLAEVERLAAIERAKFAIVTSDCGVDQVITRFCIENVWDHSTPKCYLKQFLIRQLKTLNVIANFKLIDLDIMTEFNLYNIIFAKDTLGLDDEKTVVLANLLFGVLRNNDSRHYCKSKELGPQEIEAGEYLNSVYNAGGENFAEHNDGLDIREKTLTTDIECFTDCIRGHCVPQGEDRKVWFTPQQAK